MARSEGPDLVGPVHIGSRTTVGKSSTIGKPYRRIGGKPVASRPTTILGRGCQIGEHVTIMRGARIGNRVDIDDQCLVEQDVNIGDWSRLIYHAIICNEANIGARCVIGGFVGERSKVGNDSRVFGSLIHSQVDPAAAWDATVEPAPILRHHVFVGFGSLVIGGVTIGRQSVIAAGAIVTKDVAPGSIVTGVNRTEHHSESTMKLAASKWFRGA